MQLKMSISWVIAICTCFCFGSGAFAQRPRPMTQPPHPGGLIDLALRAAVIKELGLEKEPARLTAIQKLSEAQRKDYMEWVAEPREQLRRYVGMVSIEVQTKYLPDLIKLLTHEQMTRLVQIHLQQIGLHAIYQDEVREAMNITPEQRDKLTAAEVEHSKNTDVRPVDFNMEAMRKDARRLEDAEKEWERRINEILTAEQRDQLVAMKGKPFDISSPSTTRRPPVPLREDGLVGLALREGVLQELGIEQGSAQADELLAFRDEMRKEGQKNHGYLTPEELDDPLSRPLKTQIKFDAKLAEVLKPEQYSRVLQLDLQSRGKSAFIYDANLWKALDLTLEQQQKLTELHYKYLEERWITSKAAADQPAGGGVALREKLQDQRRKQEEQALEILTKEQRDKLVELQGKPFDLKLLRPTRFVPPAAPNPMADEAQGENK
jgi:Spy/CpxP family protein refolding chaperone